jgi:arylsulfatase A-like enzyme
VSSAPRRLSAALLALLLLCCAAEDARLVVRWRLGGPEPLASDPPLPVRPRRVGTDVRETVAVAADSSFRVALEGPARRLVFSSALTAPDGCPVEVRFRVEAGAGDGWEPLFDEVARPDPAHWRDHAVDLPAGRALRQLRFSTRARWPTPGAATCAALVEPLWGSVSLLAADPAPQQRLPNVVLISLDTLGASYLGSLGGFPDASPRLDAFLADGFSFRRAYAQYGVTRTSHASLFSALYPRRHGSFPDAGARPLESLVGRLAQRGYVTVAFTEGGFVSGEFGFQGGFDRYDNGSLDPGNPAFLSAAEETFRRAAAFLARGAAAQAAFFLFVHSYEVHTPYRARDEAAREIFLRHRPADLPGIPGIVQARRILDHNDGTQAMSETELGLLRAMHVAEIHTLDRVVGSFLDALERLGLAEDTLVVLTADHGEQFGEHGRAGHGESLHNRVLHVPLGFRWPGAIAAGADDAPVQLVDVMPTILDLVGLPLPAGLDGRSLAPRLRGAALEERPAFAEMRGARGECRRIGEPPGCDRESLAVQTRRFKLIASPEPPGEALYDLQDDPLETRDVSSLHPDELARHRALLEQYRAAAGAPREAAPPVEVEGLLRDQLRALGYVE